MGRRTYSCNIAADTKVVYRRYASLFFVCGIATDDNEVCAWIPRAARRRDSAAPPPPCSSLQLATLEIVHRYVEVLDRYFGNVRPQTMLFAPLITRQVTELDLYVGLNKLDQLAHVLTVAPGSSTSSRPTLC